MASWKPIVGQAFTPDAFDDYCQTLHWVTWRPSLIVLHNTAAPTLAQRPQGFTSTHMQNLVTYYRDTKHWSAGPHLFVDDHRIWVFTPLTVSGVHSPSWNSRALGVEMLGNYETEAFDSGRGLAVQQNAVAALATLCDVLGIDSHTIKMHYEDPYTDHRCPGKNVRKGYVIQEVHDLIIARQAGDHHPIPVDAEPAGTPGG